MGELGPETDEAVLVTAHVDAHDVAEGAADNGAGTALVYDIARLLAVAEDELETGVRFVVFGSEEMKAPFERAAERLDVSISFERALGPHGDSWPFVEKGIPAVTVGSDTSDAGQGWAHTRRHARKTRRARSACAGRRLRGGGR